MLGLVLAASSELTLVPRAGRRSVRLSRPIRRSRTSSKLPAYPSLLSIPLTSVWVWLNSQFGQQRALRVNREAGRPTGPRHLYDRGHCCPERHAQSEHLLDQPLVRATQPELQPKVSGPLNTLPRPSFAASQATGSTQRGQSTWPTPSPPTPPSRSSSMCSAPSLAVSTR